MGMSVTPSPSALQGPVSVAGTETVTGALTASQLQTGTSLAALVEEQGGGRLRLNRAGAALANPGANQLKLYVRDGTTGGTLKLVAIAGAAGAETTILDNIPQ